MTAHPLIIDCEPGDIRVVASPLELRNAKTVRDAYDHNVRLRERKERDAGKRLQDVAHEAAHDLTH